LLSITIAASAIPTIAPPLRLFRILATTGANTPSNDDGWLIPRFLGQALGKGYNWLRLPQDTFRGSHSHVTTALTYIFMSHWGHFNIYEVLYFGLVLAGAKMVLLYDALTFRLKDKAGAGKWFMLPVLSAVVFSVSQMSIFEHGLQSLMTGWSQLGLALGIWALVRFPGRWTGVILCVAAAALGSFSFASGLALWPLFLAGMVLCSFKKAAQYCVFAGAALAVISLNWYFLYVDKATMGGFNKIIRWFSIGFLTDTLGRPFVNNLTDLAPTAGAARLAGYLGLTLLLVSIAVLAKAGRRALADAVPALLLVLYGIMVVWEICLTREATDPWYATFALDFWLGLVGLGYVCWYSRGILAVSPRAGGLARYWGPVMVGIILALWARSNRTWSDKSFFLRTRAPVSAATLRNYRTAPTYGEGTLVTWPMWNPSFVPKLARPLEQYHLSVFSPHQEWTLQGDSILDTVEYHQPPGQGQIFWSQDSSPRKASCFSYRHLNVVVGSETWVSWKVTLPATLERADFTSAVSIVDSAPGDGSLNYVDFMVYVRSPGEAEKEVLFRRLEGVGRGWQGFVVPLSEYKGQTITLRLTSNSVGVAGDWGMYRYPVIDLDTHEQPDSPVQTGPITPSNTDLYAGFQQPTAADFHLDVSASDSWKPEELERVAGDGNTTVGWLVNGTLPSLEYVGPLTIKASDYKRFYIKIAASTDLAPRLVTVYCKTLGEGGFGLHQFSIPLLPDTEELHTYTFDLRLAGDLDGSELTGLKITLLEPRAISPVVTPASWVSIDSVGFIRAKDDSKIISAD
jgi:hypothetical protein